MATDKPTNLLSPKKLCSVADCDGVVSCRGFCEKHYCRWRRHGDTGVTFVERTTAENFWAQVSVDAETGCWQWQGTIDPGSGYGKVNFNGRQWRAHRLAWSFANGRAPKLPILHSCDNRPCVNPAHLREGTPKDNTLDALSRGRITTKLTDDQVLEIRALLKSGKSERQVASLFGLEKSTVHRIKLRRSWHHLPETQEEV